MRHVSSYLNWYVSVPELAYDLRSSGLSFFDCDLSLGTVDLSVNYARGNPETIRRVADYYQVHPGNVFVSSEGASGQNARVMRVLAELLQGKDEAVVEFPTYEPLLRQAQAHFRVVRRFERPESEGYRLNAEAIRRAITPRTGLVVLTNPHAPSASVADRGELREVMQLAHDHGFFVVCDEIYAEFNRAAVPSLFSVDSERAVVTTSFTKAFGLGGLRLGTALASHDLVDRFYADTLHTIGNSSNLVQTVAAKILAHDQDKLRRHVARWSGLKQKMEQWLDEMQLPYTPNRVGVTYWVETPMDDTYLWTNEVTIKKFRLAAVPGAFFLFNGDHRLGKSRMLRLGLGAVDPDAPFESTLEVLEKTMTTR